MIVRAPVIVTMNGPPLKDGAVRIRGDRIIEVALHRLNAQEQTIELPDCVLLPGLINAHCHLEYTCLRGKIPQQNSFTSWIRAINAEKAKLSRTHYLRAIAHGIREAERFGTTAIVNLEAFSDLIASAKSAPLRTWWCAELIDVNDREPADKILTTALQQLRTISEAGGNSGVAPHALFTASAELFRCGAEIASANGWLLTTHLAESGEEMEMFQEASGPLYNFLRKMGRDMADCGRKTPLSLFLDLGAAGGHALSSWVVAHLNELSESDFELLDRLANKFSIAHCPRSHRYFQHTPFQFERLRALGFNICLGTDSLASNTDLSLFLEMLWFQKAHPQLAPENILRMTTVNPAKALGRAHELGKIARGYFADMIALPLSGSTDVYEQIINFTGEVCWMAIGGQII
jgi:cytosine/adenosine deaminase-related metal-dependent hydrolase